MCHWVCRNKACLFCWLDCCQLDKHGSCCFSVEKQQISVALLVWCSCAGVVWHGSAQVVGGRMVILSPQMDRKSPGVALKSHRQCSLHTVCVCACVCICGILCGILVFVHVCAFLQQRSWQKQCNPPLMQQMPSLSAWVALQIIRSVTHTQAYKHTSKYGHTQTNISRTRF